MPAETQPVCFNCARTDDEVPVIAWSFRSSPLWVCSECMPLLIHKLDQVLAALAAERREEKP